jgi:hypothetical protein
MLPNGEYSGVRKWCFGADFEHWSLFFDLELISIIWIYQTVDYIWV